MINSPLPCTTVWRLVSGGPTTDPLLKIFQLTFPFSFASFISNTYICIGLQFILWYKGFPTFSDWGGWWPNRRAIGGSACPSAWAGAERWGASVLLELWPGFPGETGEEAGLELAGTADVELCGNKSFTASSPLRSAPGETGPEDALATWGGVWIPLVCSAAFPRLISVPGLVTFPSTPWLEEGFESQFTKSWDLYESNPDSAFCSTGVLCLVTCGSPPIEPRRSYPSTTADVTGDPGCTGLSKEPDKDTGDNVPPFKTGDLSPFAGDRLPSRELDVVGLCVLGLNVPQRPFTHGTSSVLRTGDWERCSLISAPRAGGVALMGDGRECKLGLRGALPLGAWLKTTTHCPT